MKRGTAASRLLSGWHPFLLIICVWALLYLPHLRTSPGWYGDETLTHHTSRNLASGVASNFALWNTFWHPHYPYQAAYCLISGTFARAVGGDLVGSRFFNTLLALSAAFAMFGLGRRHFGIRAALFATLMFLTYQQTIIHFRMSYAHNAAGLGLLLMTLFLLRKSQSRSNLLAGVGLMICAASHPLFVNGAVAAFVYRIRRPRSWIPLFLPAGVCVVASLAAAYAVFGDWLWEDLKHLKNVHTARGDQDGGGWQGVVNFIRFVGQDWFHLGMLAGLLICFRLRRYAAPVIGLIVLFLLVRNRQNLIVFYYQAIIILPVLCLGWAGLWRLLEMRLRRLVPEFRGAISILGLVPVFLLLSSLPVVVSGDIRPRNHLWVTQSTREVEAAAAWINERTGPGDTVGGNPNIAWLLDAETIPYLQMITWYGIPTQGYENGNKRERFRFDASLENTKYAVIGDIDQRWTFGEPNVIQLFDKMEEERWPIVWAGDYYLIRRNPRFSEPNRPGVFTP